MNTEKKFTIAALVVSVAAAISTGSVVFSLQQQIAAIASTQTSIENQHREAVKNWQEAQRHIDLGVLHESIANCGMATGEAREQILHTVSAEIGRAWFYKQLAVTTGGDVLTTQQQAFQTAQNEANKVGNVGPITAFFDTIFQDFQKRLTLLENEQKQLQRSSSKLQLSQRIATHSATALQVAAILLAILALQYQRTTQHGR